MAWPRLREELDVSPTAALASGEPSWVLHDPIRHQFFRLDWLSFEILSRWDLENVEAIIHAVERDTPLHVEEADIEKLLTFLTEQQLLAQDNLDSAGELAKRLSDGRPSWCTWLIHHYLFFRIPLVKPDAWLTRWQGVAGYFFSKQFLWLTAFALFFGLYEVFRQWEVFTSFLLDNLTFQGILSYGVALIVVKLLHELGHAFSAKRQGCRVPAMGVAFLVMWPMAYTDTNEAWRIQDKWKRLQIASAGIATEMIIASWATLAWALLPDGSLRSSAFFLATLSLLATLAINASPFMRFDGYFILMDALDMPNLHNRSFALARWKMREFLFGLGEKKPEFFSRWKERALIVFAIGIWIYRLVLFLGLALLVYHFFTKLLGIVLFAIEITWFIWMPIRNELTEWWKRRTVIVKARRARWTGSVATLLLLGFVLPMPTRIMVEGLLRPSEYWQVYAPGPSMIAELPFQDGAIVQKNAMLVRMQSPDAQSQSEVAINKYQATGWSAAIASVPGREVNTLAYSQKQNSTAYAEYLRAKEQLNRYLPTAPFAGKFRLADPDLRVGQWVDRNEKIGVLLGEGAWQIETWLDGEQIKRVRKGDAATFMSVGLAKPINAKVRRVDADATRILPDGLLAAPMGGHILARYQSNQWIPEQSVYHVVFELQDFSEKDLDFVQRGNLVIQAKPASILGRYLTTAISVVLRELNP